MLHAPKARTSNKEIRLDGLKGIITPVVRLKSAAIFVGGAFYPEPARQLSAGGIDVVAARFSYGNDKSCLLQNIAEHTDVLIAGAFVSGVWKGIERNQIELAGNIFDQFDQFARMLRLIVYSVQHDVFESDEIPGCFD